MIDSVSYRNYGTLMSKVKSLLLVCPSSSLHLTLSGYRVMVGIVRI